MTFLQPFVLLGLPLVLLPILIHLINRMRHRPQPWGAMQFLVKATRSSVSRSKLRQFLILACRVLAVLMLIFFLSRPLSGGWLGWAVSSAPDAIVLLVDRSPSMGTKVAGSEESKHDRILKSLQEAGKDYEGSSDLVLLDSVTMAGQRLGNVEALQTVSAAALSDAAADVPGMFQAAVDWLVKNEAGTAEIWIGSDLQRSNWKLEDPRWKEVRESLEALPQKVRIRVLGLAEEKVMNRAVTLRQVTRHRSSQGDTAELVVDLVQSRLEKEQLPVTVTMGSYRAETDVEMSGSGLRWRHQLPLGEAEAGWGTIELPADGNDRDNLAYFVVGPAQALHVGVMAAMSDVGRLLELAGRVAMPGVEMEVERWRRGELSGVNWDPQTVIFWQGELPEKEAGDVLVKFVESGGQVVVFPPGRPDGGRFAGVGWGDVEEGLERPFRVEHWDEQEGLLARTDQGWSLPLEHVEIHRRQKIEAADGMMAWFEDGEAFLVRRSIGKGHVHFVSTLPVREWSGLGEGPVLVPLTSRVIQAGAQRVQSARLWAAGELLPNELAKRWENVNLAEGTNPQEQAGVYRAGEMLVAVNRPDQEDEMAYLDEEELGAVFGELPWRGFLQEGGDDSLLQGEVWRLFVILMLGFLVVEGLLMLPRSRQARERSEGGGRSERARAVGAEREKEVAA